MVLLCAYVIRIFVYTDITNVPDRDRDSLLIFACLTERVPFRLPCLFFRTQFSNDFL